MDGVLNLNKPAGMTSHDVVQQVRRLLHEKRVGHTGTLDPIATGVLVVCVGKATRIAQYLEAADKEYDTVLRLGVITDTLDAEGRVIERRDYIGPDRETILSRLTSLTGAIMQTPPAYSAIKVRGVASYKLARQGKAEPLKPRSVTIHDIRLIDYADPFISLRVHCSKGVYIRSLCSDLGESLGPGAHMTSLTRTRSGRFRIEDSMTLDQLALRSREGSTESCLASMDAALEGSPAVTVSEEEARRIEHGNGLRRPDSPFCMDDAAFIRIHTPAGRLLALGRTGSGELRPVTVFT